MGKIINNRTLTAENLLRLPSPVILLCAQRLDFDKIIMDADTKFVNLNLPLAKALTGKTRIEIRSVITDTVIDLMPKNEAVYLTDYEMLFDPRYELDVIKLFCEISRHNRLTVKWCGILENDSLIYAEPGFDDYSKYKISEYKIACII